MPFCTMMSLPSATHTAPSNIHEPACLLNYTNVRRPAMQITGQELQDISDPLLSDEKWVYAPTELRHAERVKQALAVCGLTDLENQDVLFILSVLDGHGLFHQPI